MKDDKKEAIRIVRANEKIIKKYWNEKKTWSRNELLDFISNEVTLDTIT